MDEQLKRMRKALIQIRSYCDHEIEQGKGPPTNWDEFILWISAEVDEGLSDSAPEGQK